MNDSARRNAFLAQFRRHAADVRRARLLSFTLVGLGVGACLLALLFGARHWLFAAWLPFSVLPRIAAVVLLGGLFGGLGFGLRRRFSDEELASYLDSKLHTEDAVSAALTPERVTRWLGTVYERATGLLSESKSSRPPILRLVHLTIPLGLSLAFPWVWIEPHRPELTAPPVGSELTRLDTLDGLLALERLEGLDPIDPATKKRLDALREQARNLQKQLERGMERRQAQASIAELRDQVEALQGELVSGENQAGLAAAVEELQKEALTRPASDALGEGDIVRFDREMKKLATALEKEARERAREALARAQHAAGNKGSKALSSALREQQRLFEQRERASRWLRQLASALPDDTARALSQATERLSAEQMKQLIDAVDKALQSLDDGQRRALGEHLRKAIENGELGDAPLDQQQLQKLSQDIAEGDAALELQRLLEQLAEHAAASEMMQGLEQAQNGLSRAEQRLRGILPLPQSAPQAAQGNSHGGGSDPSAQGGPGTGPGTAPHAGETQRVDAPELRALAQPRLDGQLPLRGATRGRSPARAGEVAATPFGSDLSGVTADELRGVEHSNIPEEYREQVSRYFAQ